MSLKINCPLLDDTPDLSNQDCAVHFGQIVRLIFARTAGVGIVTNQATATDPVDITDANMDTALGASGDDRVVFTPNTENVILPQGEAVFDGGDDNTTLFGQQVAVGRTNIQVTGRFRGLNFNIKEEMEAYISESATYNQMGVYLVDEFQRIVGDYAAGVLPAGVLAPIPVNSFFIGDPGSEGYNTHTFTPFSFNLNPGWANSLTRFTKTPDFNPIVKVNP